MNIQEKVLSLGQSVKIRSGIFRPQIAVFYTGKIGESTYSIAISWSFGNNTMAYNLYFPKNQKEISTPAGKIDIISVDADRLVFFTSPGRTI